MSTRYPLSPIRMYRAHTKPNELADENNTIVCCLVDLLQFEKLPDRVRGIVKEYGRNLPWLTPAEKRDIVNAHKRYCE